MASTTIAHSGNHMYNEMSYLTMLPRGQHTSVFYDFYPLNVVGWHGSLSVLRLNVRHLRSLMSDGIHRPPSAHTTFQAPGFVVCTFTPRPMEGDPAATGSRMRAWSLPLLTSTRRSR